MLCLTLKFAEEDLLIKIPESTIKTFSQLSELNFASMPLQLVASALAKQVFEYLVGIVKPLAIQEVSFSPLHSNGALVISNSMLVACPALYGSSLNIATATQELFDKFHVAYATQLIKLHIPRISGLNFNSSLHCFKQVINFHANDLIETIKLEAQVLKLTLQVNTMEFEVFMDPELISQLYCQLFNTTITGENSSIQAEFVLKFISDYARLTQQIHFKICSINQTPIREALMFAVKIISAEISGYFYIDYLRHNSTLYKLRSLLQQTTAMFTPIAEQHHDLSYGQLSSGLNLHLPLIIGNTVMQVNDLMQLNIGDLLLLDECIPDSDAIVRARLAGSNLILSLNHSYATVE